MSTKRETWYALKIQNSLRVKIVDTLFFPLRYPNTDIEGEDNKRFFAPFDTTDSAQMEFLRNVLVRVLATEVEQINVLVAATDQKNALATVLFAVRKLLVNPDSYIVGIQRIQGGFLVHRFLNEYQPDSIMSVSITRKKN